MSNLSKKYEIYVQKQNKAFLNLLFIYYLFIILIYYLFIILTTVSLLFHYYVWNIEDS